MGIQISARKSGTVTILDVRGRIVIGDNSDSFRAELRKLAESAPCDVLVNLAGVTGMDSSGISALVQSFVTLKRDGGSLKILNPTGSVREVLELTGLIKCLPTYTDEAIALASFRRSSAHA
ncbi:MAG: STAS domain-containing protein [Candidatus Acidiferrales bacterium]|jgi:anti-sigma B factor antagonist